MTVPLWEKYLLTIEEAAVYFGIGENRLRELAALDMKREFTIDNGNRTLIKRKKFEGWLDEKRKFLYKYGSNREIEFDRIIIKR